MKLVRDNIPAIMKARRQASEVHVATDKEYLEALKEKLREETSEFLKDNNTEELADILEVVYALAHQQGISRQEIEELREKKAAERGGFRKRLILH